MVWNSVLIDGADEMGCKMFFLSPERGCIMLKIIQNSSLTVQLIQVLKINP